MTTSTHDLGGVVKMMKIPGNDLEEVMYQMAIRRMRENQDIRFRLAQEAACFDPHAVLSIGSVNESAIS
jgi:hypothetical protein